MHGEFYGNRSSRSDSRFALDRYLEKGPEFAKDLSGIFQIAIFDGRQGKLLLISDQFGLQPLYYTVPSGGGFAFAGEVRALLQVPGVSRQPNERSIADFLHYGQVLGQKTLFADIHLLAPGTVLTHHLDTGKTRAEPYFSLRSIFSEKGAHDRNADPAAAVDQLEQAIQLRSGGKDQLGLSLSGGLDSRGILAGLGAGAKGLQTYTLGLPGCADEGLAHRMARCAGTRHEFVPLEADYLQGFESMAEGMIRLSDGFYHPHESTEMLALKYFERAPFRILLRGHGGEIAKASLAYPVMARPEIDGFRAGKQVFDYILGITNLVRRDIEPDRLFHPLFFEAAAQAPEDSLAASIGDVTDVLEPADVCIYYYINEHIRRQVVASLEIFRTRIAIRLPYVDECFIANLLKLPVHKRYTGEIHHLLVRKCMPALLKIPNSNTGAPMDAGLLRLFVTDKFNSLMKRLSIKGFRHYTEFQKWHRQAFRDASEGIIFGERARQRQLYDMAFLRTVFDSHMSGKKDYGHLLGTITGLELWHRMFVD
jgi:asparagine synthase (glutamine-hydrolysing)